MTQNLIRLSTGDINALIDALNSGRLPDPYSTLMISKSVPSSVVDVVASDLHSLAAAGFTSIQIAMLLASVRDERQSRRRLDEEIELVTTGPEAPGATNRDTSVVVRELFRQATQSVLVVGYAIYQGQQVFQSLAQRMDEVPSLDVTMCLNLPSDETTDVESLIVRRFSERFVKSQWPTGHRLPSVFYDPRSVDPVRSKRASLHAKCIVVDQKDVFISSANFTERAQFRNVEVGVLISSPIIAQQLTRHFATLRASQLLKPINIPKLEEVSGVKNSICLRG